MICPVGGPNPRAPVCSECSASHQGDDHVTGLDLDVVMVEMVEMVVLVGGDWNMFYFLPYIWNNHPSSLIFFRAIQTTN